MDKELACRVWGLGFRAWGSGSREYDSGFRVQGMEAGIPVKS
jgi:hypothetical protein